MEEEKWLTSADVIQLLDISVRTLYRYREKNLLHVYLRNNTPRYSRLEVLKLRYTIRAQKDLPADKFDQQVTDIDPDFNPNEVTTASTDTFLLQSLYIIWASVCFIILLIQSLQLRTEVGFNSSRYIFAISFPLILFIVLLTGAVQPLKTGTFPLICIGHALKWTWVLAFFISALNLLNSDKSYSYWHIQLHLTGVSLLSLYTLSECRKYKRYQLG